MTDTTARPQRLLTMTLGFDRSLVWDRGHSVRYLIADITAPPVNSAPVKPKGLNLALVIDASGSMQGPPLEAAKAAAMGVAERMGEADQLSVVSFASDVILHVGNRAMDQVGRRQAVEAIRRLQTRGSTDLCAGWVEGARAVALAMETRSGCRNQVVLLSDGHANQGVVDPGELAQIAGNLRERGLFTSTVGIGDGYSPAQLEVIAEAGGGRMHDAEIPEEIVEVVMAELADVQATVAENVVLEVEVPAGVHVEALGTFPLDLKEGRARCALGSLIGSARRRVVLKVKTPAGTVGQELVFSGRLNWREPGNGVEQAGRTHPAALRFAAGKENSAQGRDIAASVEVARLWQSLVVRRAVEFNRDGAFGVGSKYLAAQCKYFEKYCRGLPGTEELVEQLHMTFRGFDRPWSERSRKEIGLANMKAYASLADHRSQVRAHWSTLIPKGPRGPRDRRNAPKTTS